MMKTLLGKRFLATFLVFLFFLLLGGNYLFAQNNQDTLGAWKKMGEGLQRVCPDNELSVEGVWDVKKGVEQHYTIKTRSASGDQKIIYELRQGEKSILSQEAESFSYTFDKLGSYTLKVIEMITGCSLSKTYDIHVYDKIYVYIGPSTEEFALAREGAASSGLYVKEFLSDEKTKDQMTQILANDVYYLEHADVLLLESSAVSPFFETLSTLQQLVGFTIRDVDLYVLADINQSAFRRMLARYHGVMGLEKIYVVRKEYMGSLFTSLFLQKDMSQSKFVKTYAISLDYSNKLFVVSYLVDYLLQHEFPISTLLFILMLPLLVLLISIFRQVIGLSIFGVFNPLLFTFSLYVIGIPLTFTFFVSAFVATLFVRMFTKKIYLLYSAKISILIVLYSILSLVALWAVDYFGRGVLEYNLFQNTYIIFPFLFLIMVGDRVFSEKFALFGKGRRVGLFEFLLVSAVMYKIISSLWVQNLLLGYPELSLVSIVILILVGRFTGLQLLEYIRFMPLIKHYFEEE